MARTPKKTKKPAHSNRKFIVGFWTLFGIGILVSIFIFLLAGWGAFGKMPSFDELENPETNLATEIFSSDGETLGKYYSENRTPIKYDDLPEHLVQALVATEDERFYQHAGIDAKGTVRAAVYLGTRGGASTITQQLAKQLFTEDVAQNNVERVFQKVKEWVISTRLERQYTKEEIITMYFNKYDFIYQAVGIRSASKIYFDKEPRDLKIEESAVLVGMLKNSALYNPMRRPEMVKDRRNQVFEQMNRNGFLSEQEMDSLQKLPMKIEFTPEGHDEGMATYFRAYLQKFMRNWIEENPKPDGSEYSLFRDGLKIYTSLDSKMQEYAEDAVTKHISHIQKEFDRQNENNSTAPFRDIDKSEVESLVESAMQRSARWNKMEAQGKSEEEIRNSFTEDAEMRVFSWKGTIDTVMTPRDSILYYKSFLQAGMMSMVPQTGEVKAWVGGTNFKHFKYDHVKQGKRQVGSTFKPFVYATAIDQLKFSPCDTLPRARFTIEAGKHGNQKDWSPKNAGNDGYEGMISLKEALAKSVNTVTARLIDKTGPGPVIDLAKKLGVDVSNIPKVPSIALGTADLSLFEMVSAFSTFANQGVYVKPVLVNRIEDKNGTVLYQHVPETRDVLSKEAAYVTTTLLEGVTQSGSGIRLRGTWAKGRQDYERAVTGYPYDFKNPIAGKTGTTQNQSDGWFIGMVPNLATGVWVGAEDRAVHFPGIRYGQGATMALPIWGMYMKDVYKNEDLKVSKDAFERPKNLSIEVNCDNYGANQNTNDSVPDELDF
ncbi:penicillin-binding protein 1A [Christiangramia forsetii]|uniref:Bifunctional transglycosylase/transpeptidase penicillin-binding protein n=2 Tax=Christiangramia forsetii TaxID=411153 RepID=A0M6D9_CHRFK|nr:transglycosylase domain-containing protein [Christiangramia forsetii]GGG30641.1 penicillin-binding protein 1A [Christiangramia forsetii]CAL68184.1 bifunctional transglycosylase/transpeptidase penicillin-binding protein [Christiangramia forsetii KT0803]